MKAISLTRYAPTEDRMECAYSGRYKGKRAPKCAGGIGCRACWEKYAKALEERVRVLEEDLLDAGGASPLGFSSR
jgi:purine-nucleoside phosphorylase